MSPLYSGLAIAYKCTERLLTRQNDHLKLGDDKGERAQIGWSSAAGMIQSAGRSWAKAPDSAPRSGGRQSIRWSIMFDNKPDL